MKRLALLAVTALLLAACASTETSSPGGPGDTDGGGGGELPECPLDALDSATQPVEVVVWHTQQAKVEDTLKALVEQYNSSQSRVKVRLESQGSSYEEIQQKFNAAVAGGGLPGLIMVDDTFTQSMADSGVVLPAQSCIDASGYDMSDFRETVKAYYTIDGVLWAASANPANILLFYNKNHFRAAGLDPEVAPKTLAEVREYSQKIKDAGVVGTPFVHEFASWKTEFWLTGAGSSVVDNDNGRGGGQTTAATLAGNAQATELFTWFKDMQAAGLINAIPAVPGQIEQYLALAGQKGSMAVESTSAATSIEAFLGGDLDTSSVGDGSLGDANVSGLDIGAAVFPGLSEPGKTQMGGPAWYILDTSPPEVQAAAWDFMTFLNSADAQAQMLIGGSALPYRQSTNDLPEVQDFYAGSLSGQWLKIANDQLDELNPDFPGPLIGPYDLFRQDLEKAQEDLMFGSATPESALDQAQQAVDEDIADYNADL